MNWSKIKYFKSQEFDCPDEPGSGEKMNQHFVELLDIARIIFRNPIKITSGYRTKEYNQQIGGAENSAHIKGLGADISANKSNRFQIVTALIQAGFKRMKIYKNHIHVDSDSDKIQNWLGIQND